MKQQLLSKIQNHTAPLAIIGLGYVGLPLADKCNGLAVTAELEVEKRAFNATGCDLIVV